MLPFDIVSEVIDSGHKHLKAALDRAIDDERHAIAFYRAVLEKHGQRRPFSNIINAERRHEAALLAQYARLGYEVPADRWADHEFAIADRFADLCDASVVAEVRNGRIYDELIEAFRAFDKDGSGTIRKELLRSDFCH